METWQKSSVIPKQVEIKVVQVGKKQMSVSMCRQLPVEEIVDQETGSLKGTPWGIIRHSWTNCCAEGNVIRQALYRGEMGLSSMQSRHYHILWEMDGKLYICDGNVPVGIRRACKELDNLDQLFISV